MSLKPLGHRLIIKPEPAKTQSAGGILIPETAGKAPSMTGTVVSVGRGPATAHRVRQETLADCVKVLNEIADNVPASALRSELNDELARMAIKDVYLSEVNEGDFVMFSPHVGTNLTVDGEPYITLAEDDVEAVWSADEQEVA